MIKALYGAVFALVYDIAFTRAERNGLRAMRRELLDQSAGRVLEVGAGTGLNIQHYGPNVTSLVLTEPEPHMAAKLRQAARQSTIEAQVVEAPAERLPFPDASFDTVVGTLVLCTVPDPDAAVREIRRVLRPGGRFLFIEHVRSPDGRLASWQDRLRGPWSIVACGCQCNRDTLQTVARVLSSEHVEHDRLIGLTPLVRPLIRGQARAE